MWDNSVFHRSPSGGYDWNLAPLYILWCSGAQPASPLLSALLTDNNSLSKVVLQQIMTSIRCNDLTEPLKRLAEERHKLQSKGVERTHSIYRDILFLALIVAGQSSIDFGAFHREYANAYDRLVDKECKGLFKNYDAPISQTVICCRHYFKQLLLDEEI
ncbi:C-myc promoter-binding protein-like [Ctenocephalides felis]|uniref:C-myc promoter-binding protein-like n=1 Tax=Ctenocephalides felis TaxID=7515 RepID=UPI000E6E4889|nr:C-myc promoter-binding protein-like [Ctenocephalides felis]